MAKKKSTLVNMVVSLLVITAVSGAVLGFIYNLTKDSIAKVESDKNNAAIATVLKTDRQIASTETDTIDDLVYNLAYDDQDNLIGAAVKTFSNKGFNGKIELMVGILDEGKINRISVLSQSETPGLGANMTNDKFLNQFNAINTTGFTFKVKKDGGDVDALTAATISSRAISEAIDLAVTGYNSNRDRFIKKGVTDNE